MKIIIQKLFVFLSLNWNENDKIILLNVQKENNAIKLFMLSSQWKIKILEIPSNFIVKRLHSTYFTPHLN